jgi:hypothetical protein
MRIKLKFHGKGEEKNSYIWAFFVAQSTKNSGLINGPIHISLIYILQLYICGKILIPPAM